MPDATPTPTPTSVPEINRPLLPPRSGHWDWANWIRGLLSGAISGACTSALSTGFLAVKDPKDFALGTTDQIQMSAVIAAGGFVVAFLNYLRQNPLPALIVEEETVTKTVSVTKSKTMTPTEVPAPVPTPPPSDPPSDTPR